MRTLPVSSEHLNDALRRLRRATVNKTITRNANERPNMLTTSSCSRQAAKSRKKQTVHVASGNHFQSTGHSPIARTMAVWEHAQQEGIVCLLSEGDQE